jgi:serine/threonine protein kinase
LFDCHSQLQDWWSFGTMMFEMLTGLPPFYTEDVQQMYTKILTTKLEMPKTMSTEAAELLHGLLERDVEKRLQVLKKLFLDVIMFLCDFLIFIGLHRCFSLPGCARD